MAFLYKTSRNNSVFLPRGVDSRLPFPDEILLSDFVRSVLRCIIRHVLSIVCRIVGSGVFTISILEGEADVFHCPFSSHGVTPAVGRGEARVRRRRHFTWRVPLLRAQHQPIAQQIVSQVLFARHPDALHRRDVVLAAKVPAQHSTAQHSTAQHSGIIESGVNASIFKISGNATWLLYLEAPVPRGRQ